MWRNYLTVGIRALAKSRVYAGINIFGLAVGMAACLMILLFVRDQLSYDRFWPDADRVYQLQAVNTDTETGARDPMQSSPYATGPALRKDFPQVEALTYASNWQPVIMLNGQPQQRTITLVGADFFRIFALPFLHGNAATALRDTNSVAMSERTAIAMFGTTNAVGRSITVQERAGDRDLKVTAVFADVPKNSHQQFGMVALQDPAKLATGQETAWGWFAGYNYAKLKPGTDVAALNAQLDAWKERNAPKTPVGGRMVSDAAQSRYSLVALPDVHLGEGKGGPARNEEDRGTIVTFAVLAVLILVMACVNFVNLATARASQRAREVALRKVLGAGRGQLVTQFLAESVIVASIAMLVALALVELGLPWLRDFLRAGIPLRYFGMDGVLLPAIGLVLLVGLAGGLYPAFYLTRFQPSQVLKANKSSAEPQGSGRLRNGLVVVQFAISIGLIVCTSVVYAQTIHARSVDPGFRREGLVQIEGASRSRVRPVTKTLEQEFARTPGVAAVARTSIAMNTGNRSNNSVLLPGRPNALVLGTYAVGWNYFETMGMKLLAGRTLSESHAMDDATTSDEPDPVAEKALIQRGINVVVNESSAHQMGFATPQAAIGRQIRIALVTEGEVPATIVGVVADTRFRSAREQVEDMIFYHADNGQTDYFIVRADMRDPAATMARLEAVWKKVIPTVPFDAQFSQDAARDLYRSDEATGTMFAAFSGLAIVIGCLGLFGLAAFTAERRTKEIGIRKVLGARTRDIVRLLVWQFSRPVLIANLIAWPAAWWVMRGWLNGFDDRIGLGPAPFVLAGLLALAIAVATIAGHAVRVAQASPIRALRYE